MARPRDTNGCSAPGCEGKVKARGLCEKHYRREIHAKPRCAYEGCGREAFKLGYCRPHEWVILDQLPEGVVAAKLDEIAAAVTPDAGTGCWLAPDEWIHNGYAHISVAGNDWLVHRFLWAVFYRGHPNTRELDHLGCVMPSCVRPNHLQPVTHRVNVARAVQRAKLPEPRQDDWRSPINLALMLWAHQHNLPAIPSNWEDDGSGTGRSHLRLGWAKQWRPDKAT